MENKNKSKKILRIFFRTLAALLVIYLIILVARVVELKREESEAIKVREIHDIRINLDDADGNKLPPVPDDKENNATVSGVDANGNYVRDDVELYIFDTYKDIKERAAWMQYAQAQNLVLFKVDSKETLKAVMEGIDRADNCLTDYFISLDSYVLLEYKEKIKNIDEIIFNTNLRKSIKKENYKFMTSSGSVSGQQCDIMF